MTVATTIPVGHQILSNGEILELLGPHITPEAYAHRMWKLYKIARKRIDDRPFQQYHRKTPKIDAHLHINPDMLNRENFDYVRKLIISTNQGGRSLIGGICNRIIQVGYGNLFRHTHPEIIVESNHGIGQATSKRRKIDVYIGNPNLDAYISITTTPRERKMGDWPHEYAQLSAVNVGSRKKWKFVGLAFEWEASTRDANISELPQAMLTVAVENIEDHSKFLKNLGSDLW